MVEKVFPIVRHGQEVGSVTLKFSERNRPAVLNVVSGPIFLRSEYAGSDYFYALIEMRKDLEKHEYRIACNGCLKYVYPSGMLADMTNGLMAYKLVDGECYKVKIMDSVTRSEYRNLSTVEEQKEERRRAIKVGGIGRTKK